MGYSLTRSCEILLHAYGGPMWNRVLDGLCLGHRTEKDVKHPRGIAVPNFSKDDGCGARCPKNLNNDMI